MIPTATTTDSSMRVRALLLRALSGWVMTLGLAAPTWGQTPVVAALTPTRNTVGVPSTTSVTVRFGQALSNNLATQRALSVFSGMADGKKAGLATVSGNTLTLQPRSGFVPGETVVATLTTAAQGRNGENLGQPHVFQFTTAAGKGPGTFSGSQEVALPSASHSVTFGDVDGDGDLDLLTANPSTNTVSVRLNDGTGTFSGGQEVVVGSQPLQVETADVDGDGDLDLLTANYGTRQPLPGSVSVRFNDGTGTFSGGSEVGSSASLTRLTTGDVDGDGDLDLLVASHNNTNGVVAVYLNNGRGSFGTGVAVYGPANDLALGDVDSDGDLDLLLPRANSVALLLNNGNGRFAEVATIAVGNVATNLVLGDLDHDGDLDLLTSNTITDYAGSVSVRLNDGRGTFSGSQEVAVGAGPAAHLADVDGDGDFDLLTANYASGNGSTVSVRLNDGRGTFSGSQEVAVGLGVVSVVAGDIDGDGDLDFATANGNSSASVRRNQLLPVASLTKVMLAAGPVGSTVTLTGTYFTPTTTVSFNGVAATTVTVTSATQLTAVVPAGATTGLVRVTNATGTSNGLPFTVSLSVQPTAPLRNALAAAYTTPVTLAFTQPLSSETATQTALKVFSQQTGGMKTGVASVRGNSLSFAPTVGFRAGETIFATLTAAAQSKDHTPATPQVFQFTTATAPSAGVFANKSEISLSTYATAETVGDVDGDGDLDLLVAEGANNAVTILLNDGTGRFSNNQRVPVGAYPNSVVVGDLDDDGDLDLLTTNYASGTVSVCLNNGAGEFTSTGQVVYVKDNLVALTLGDVDEDGDLDLLVGNGASANVTSTISVLLNDGRGLFGRKQEVIVGNYPASLTVGDIDGDGDLDLLVGNQVSNTVSVRLNDGAGTFSGTQELAENVPYRVQLADVDGDGDLDLLTATIQEGRVSVRLNDGQGSFGESQTVSVGAHPNSLALGDVDGDGDLDLLAASNSTNTVSVRLNNGRGLFSGTQEIAVSSPAQSIALADLDGNGTLDVVAASYEGKAVSVHLNQRKESVLTAAAATLATQVSLYPNPAHASVRLLMPDALAQQSVQVRVLNILGQLVLEQHWTAQKLATNPELAVEQLPQGAYTVWLRTAQGVITKRLILE